MRQLLIMAALVAAAAVAAGCGGGGGHYARELARQNLALPSTVTLEDFRRACSVNSVTNPDRLLESLNVEIRKGWDGRYVQTSDLLAACGPGCSPDDGALGSLMAQFAVFRQTR